MAAEGLVLARIVAGWENSLRYTISAHAVDQDDAAQMHSSARETGRVQPSLVRAPDAPTQCSRMQTVIGSTMNEHLPAGGKQHPLQRPGTNAPSAWELDGAQATGPSEARVGSGSFRVGSGTARRVGKYRANGEGEHNTTEAQDERILLGTRREKGSEKGRRVGESDLETVLLREAKQRLLTNCSTGSRIAY
ncbi:hypothetical protein B0H16DRAFT_1472558 [Mycena metata]|uniref:Uncharacterized protein n=1 Tax=Mycena metata TaxID=1033252 RepID=A0AAD7HNR7_9AGAR|nr:hypothetical protein B0H16DRAFT_1472558 [Mycena metata]